MESMQEAYDRGEDDRRLPRLHFSIDRYAFSLSCAFIGGFLATVAYGDGYTAVAGAFIFITLIAVLDFYQQVYHALRM